MTPNELASHAQAGVILTQLGYYWETCASCRGTGVQQCVARIMRLKKDGSEDGEFEMRGHCSFCGGTGKIWYLKAP